MGRTLSLFTPGTVGAGTSPCYTMTGNQGDLLAGGTTTEASRQITMRAAGTFTGMWTQVNATDTGRVIRFRKNNLNGNQVVSPTDTTAGIYQDTVNSDTVAVGDTVDFSVSYNEASPFTIYALRQIFQATTGHAATYGLAAHTSSMTAASSTSYYKFCTTHAIDGLAETNIPMLFRAAGTLKNMQAYCVTARATNTTVRSRTGSGAGQSNGNMFVTLTGGVNNTLYEDTGNTDAIVSGTTYNHSVTTGTGADGLVLDSIFWTFTNPTTCQDDLFCGIGGGTTRAASATASYYTFSGRIQAQTTESLNQIPPGFSVKMSRFRINITTNTYTGNASATVRKNTGDGNQGFTITLGVAALYEDTTNTDSYAPTDVGNYKIVNGTSGSITIEYFAMLEQDQSAVFRRTLSELGTRTNSRQSHAA